MTANVGSAALLIGCMYFGFTYGFAWWIIGLMALAAGTWGYYTILDEGKELLKAQTRYYEAKTYYYNHRRDEK